MSPDGLTDAESAILEAVAERLIPGDADGPGAREARAARYVEQELRGALAVHLADHRRLLAGLDAAAGERHGRGFAALGPDAQDELLHAAQAREPRRFALVRRHVLEGMFGDPAWGGNAGGVGWALLGYDGPRLVWTEAQQRIEDVAV